MFDWVVMLLGNGGYLGIFLLMLAENLFPPIPSELVMPLAGFLAAQGAMSLPLAIVVGTAGSVAGALFWYWVGRRFGEARLRRMAERHGRWLTVSPKDVDTASVWFGRNGGRMVLLGRMVPAVRTLISIPAGVARMSLPSFLALTAAGSALWTGALAVAGFLLESQYTRVEGWVNPVSTLVVALLVLWYVVRLVRVRRV
ncbi:MAG: DedA family protein [Amaricoccus sp.]|uniref:DedA family protein n=1 Tax=Amaricoccus sp. TaxID=1872485 RepID=UPI0033150231